MLCASDLTDPLTLTWKQLAEASARRVAVKPFDRLRFVQALCDCRGLSRLEPKAFFPELVRTCAAAGVAVVLVPELKGQKTSCAHGWLTLRTAYLATTLRHRREDHFWFSLYHAGSHLILGEADCPEASRLAGELLIPPQAATALPSLVGGGQAIVKAFAQSLGIAPGIVVGRMQFEKIIRYSQFNDLKRKLDLTAAMTAQEAAWSTWPSVSEAASLLLRDLPHLNYAQSKARVSAAVNRGHIPGNHLAWQKRRVEPDALAAWRLLMRDRDLDAEGKDGAGGAEGAEGWGEAA